MTTFLLVISIILVLLSVVLFLLGGRRKTNGVDIPSLVILALILFILGIVGVFVSAFRMLI